MTRGALVAREARTWIGTPFHEQQALKGAGCDCKGLLWGVTRDLGFPEADSVHARFIAYDVGRKGGIPSRRLRDGLADLFDLVPRDAPLELGDVLRLRVNGAAQHLAIVASETTAIHASIRASERRSIVRETSLEALLDPSVCPLADAWRWRELAGGEAR